MKYTIVRFRNGEPSRIEYGPGYDMVLADALSLGATVEGDYEEAA